MLKKQPYGNDGYAIFGLKKDIMPLHWSLYNWNAIQHDQLHKNSKGEKYYRTPEYEEPISLGNPDYCYFSVSKESFIEGRRKAFLNNCDKFWPHTRNGKMLNKLATLKAEQEWTAIEDENFLEKFETEPSYYSLGHNPNHLEYINAKVNDYRISKINERIVVDNIK